MEEATEALNRGDIEFIESLDFGGDFTRAITRLQELNVIHPAVPYYAALLIPEDTKAGRFRLRTLLFASGFESSSETVTRFSSMQLLRIILQGNDLEEVRYILSFLDSVSIRRIPGQYAFIEYHSTLKAACHYVLGDFEEAMKAASIEQVSSELASLGGSSYFSEINNAINLLSEWKLSNGENADSQKILNFLFHSHSTETLRWTLGEVLSLEGLLQPDEQIALTALILAPNNLIALNLMRTILSENPLIFLRHLELLRRLGTAYLNIGAMREEGAVLFRSWSNMLDPVNYSQFANAEFAESIGYIDEEALNARIFFVNFYLGRILRNQDNFRESSEYFEKALAFAPDNTQADATIWYILMNALNGYPNLAKDVFVSMLPQMNDISYFSALFDRLSSYLVRTRQWAGLYEVFLALSDAGPGASLASYAFILGRAAEEGFIQTDKSAEDYFLITFQESNASIYYRTMAASKLNLFFSPIGAETNHDTVESEDILDFLLGFFEYGAASFALPYIRELEDDLSIHELRDIASSLTDSGRFQQSLNLIARYMRREDYIPLEPDLYLYYPRPYLELIEKYAEEADLEPFLLLALIHTESHFMAGIGSSAGATGLTQLMAATAADMAGRMARAGLTDYRSDNMDLRDPELNVHIGSYYLRHLHGIMGNPLLALLAYNGGQGRVRRWVNEDLARPGGALPLDLFLETVEFPETREYGRRVTGIAAVYGYLYYGKTMEEVASGIFQSNPE
ncbi:MAG: lytic transglycosylase domain-containing protein [Treponema sp.]|nr:lytic transglycosylase domain-containing protein [Treponema sp.]